MAEGAGCLLHLRKGRLLVEPQLLGDHELLPSVLDPHRLLHGNARLLPEEVDVACGLAFAHCKI